MADTITTNYSFIKPQVSGSPNTWGDKNNTSWDMVDAALALVSATASAALPKAGGALTGLLTTATGATADPTSVPNVGQVASLISAYLPVGAIIMWGGAIATIPTGWGLCDGTNGTPDLRDKFVVGAGSTYAPLATGGAATATLAGLSIGATVLTVDQLPSHTHTVNETAHTHPLTDPGHKHTSTGPFIDNGVSGSAYGRVASTQNYNTSTELTGITIGGVKTNITVANAGSGNPHTHSLSAASPIPTLPPYVALAFIMRIA